MPRRCAAADLCVLFRDLAVPAIPREGRGCASLGGVVNEDTCVFGKNVRPREAIRHRGGSTAALATEHVTVERSEELVVN